MRVFLSVTILLLTLIAAGCKSQRIDAPESVIIDGKVIYGAGGTCSLCSKCVYISNLQNRNFAVPLICNLILRTPSRLLQHGFCQFIYNANIMLLPLSGKAEGSF